MPGEHGGICYGETFCPVDIIFSGSGTASFPGTVNFI